MHLTSPYYDPYNNLNNLDLKKFTSDDALLISMLLGIDYKKERFNIEQFHIGLNIELEHGLIDSLTNVTNDDPILTGKLVLAHLKKVPDYYSRISKI